MRRRRFLQIVAATALAPVHAFAQDRRIAMGAEAELTLYGPPDLTARARERA
jgi:FAD:protein FMN transferase